MRDGIASTAREPLGVGRILGGTFALVLENPIPMLLAGIVPSIALVALNLAVYGPQSRTVVMAVVDPQGFAAGRVDVSGFAVLLAMLAGFAVTGVATAATTKAALQAIAGERIDIGGALRTALARLLPVAICTTASIIVVYAGLFALIVPGLWLMGLWSVLVPVIVVERRGFGAFGRSAALTKGYRWPVAGLCALFFLTIILISLIGDTLQGLAYFAGTAGAALGAIVETVVAGLVCALTGALSALLYVRLCDLQEGGAPGELARVFE